MIRNTVLGIDRLFADALHFSVCSFVRFSVSLPSFYTITLIELIFVVIVKRSHIFLFFLPFFWQEQFVTKLVFVKYCVNVYLSEP